VSLRACAYASVGACVPHIHTHAHTHTLSLYVTVFGLLTRVVKACQMTSAMAATTPFGSCGRLGTPQACPCGALRACPCGALRACPDPQDRLVCMYVCLCWCMHPFPAYGRFCPCVLVCRYPAEAPAPFVVHVLASSLVRALTHWPPTLSTLIVPGACVSAPACAHLSLSLCGRHRW
jgi:hypothetical protein